MSWLTSGARVAFIVLNPFLLASGDATLAFLFAGVCFLTGASVAIALIGLKLVYGKSDDNRRVGRRLLPLAALPIVIAGLGWLAVVGWD